MSQLGAHWEGPRTRFAVFSSNATRVTLCLFDDSGRGGEQRLPLHPGSGGTWSADVERLEPGQLYGYRVEGPWQPQNGHRFNPGKLLVDPMARAITGEPPDHASLYGYNPGSAHREDHDYNSADSAAFMPKCVVVDPSFDWQGDAPPATAWRDTVIYECHVRGMTRTHPEVDERLRGTYLGLVAPPVLEHLRRLGITAVELLPVQHLASEPHLTRRGLRNYWGYNPLGFCAPFSGYATGGHGEQVSEFKTMVRELHRAGLEVILDVVFNHNAEGDHRGPVLSLKGLDNRCYYRLEPFRKARYVNYTGCGNTLDAEQPAVRELILESLRYWVRDMHVDGFRFDLAPVLARRSGESDGFDPRAPLFESLASDPILSRVKLIAEPWDVGPRGYRLGGFPPGWAEWNDRYRNVVRRFWRGDAGTLGELATRLAGSPDLFEEKGPLSSIHFVACHDGFTLADVVRYEHKHNEANGEANHDGAGDNHSCNWGHEGASDDASVAAARDRARRNLVATLALSQGVPMIQHGDELGRTQRGNNNAYCQDNEISWIDWSTADDRFLGLVRRVLEIRRRHPVLRRDRFADPRELVWWHPDGREMAREDWENPDHRAVSVLLSDTGAAGGESDLLIFLNGSTASVHFQLPDVHRERWDRCRWTKLVETAGATAPAPDPVNLSEIVLDPYSLWVLAASGPAG